MKKYLTYIKHINEKKAFFVLSAIALVFLGGYVYFVNKTVWNVVARQNTVKEITSTSSEVAELEASYMNTSGELTLEYAYNLGFNDVKTADTKFVERSVAAVAVR